jgi:hypothetical protein
VKSKPKEREKIFASYTDKKGIGVQYIYGAPKTQQQKNPKNPFKK